MSDSVTIQFCGMELEVEFDYTPYHRGSRDSYGAPLDPDDEEELELTKLEHCGVDVTELLEYEDVSDRIWALTAEKFKGR